MVGAPRFELGTSWSRTKRATRLRYAPIMQWRVTSDNRQAKVQPDLAGYLSLVTIHCLFGRDGRI